jgi:NADPH2:quinone reductase
MKAIRVQEFGPPSVLRLEDVPDPKPGPRQVLVAVKAAGVNPVDTYIRAGLYARKPTLPYTPGSDAGGVVEAVGAEVTRFKAGDRVYTAGTITGTYAQKTLCEETQVQPLPERVSFSQAAGIYVPYATAYRGLTHTAKAQPGETILVNGASGGVGIAAVQIARALGMRVIGTGGSDRGRALVREQGAHVVLDHHLSDFTDQVLAATGGRGPDVILEMLANVNLEKDLKMIGPRGRIVVIGNRGRIEIDPRDAMTKESAILGFILWGATAAELAIVHAALYAGLENGALRPVVGQEMPLREAARAHETVMAHGAYGKIALIP